MNNFDDFLNKQNWIFAKTMSEIPHYYIVRDSLSLKDANIFDNLKNEIKEKGYIEEFQGKNYQYLNIGEYKYWVMDNILNRTKIENKK